MLTFLFADSKISQVIGTSSNLRPSAKKMSAKVKKHAEPQGTKSMRRRRQSAGLAAALPLRRRGRRRGSDRILTQAPALLIQSRNEVSPTGWPGGLSTVELGGMDLFDGWVAFRTCGIAQALTSVATEAGREASLHLSGSPGSIKNIVHHVRRGADFGTHRTLRMIPARILCFSFDDSA